MDRSLSLGEMARRFLSGRGLACIQNRTYLAMDARSILKYGPRAPRKYQLAFWSPAAITEAMVPGSLDWVERDVVRSAPEPLEYSHELIRDGDWDQRTIPVEAVTPYRSTVQRLQGKPWIETSEFTLLLRAAETDRPVDGLNSRQAILRRYAAVDRMVEDLRHGGEIRPTRDLGRGFREQGGICVAIARDGRVLFALSGNHRLAAAAALGKTIVPVSIRHVHPGALAAGCWDAFRRESSRLGYAYRQHGSRGDTPVRSDFSHGMGRYLEAVPTERTDE